MRNICTFKNDVWSLSLSWSVKVEGAPDEKETDESVTDGKMEGYLYRKPTMDAPNRKAPIR